MTSGTPTSRLVDRLDRAVPAGVRNLSRTAVAFGLVGLGGMVIDLTVFNVLRLGLLGPSFSLTAKPLTASVVSAGFAIVFNWAGSRYWAFRETRRRDALKEFAEYVLVALLGLGIGLATLAFTHYTLGFNSLAADNVSKNVIGLALGTSARFLLLRFWVYAHGRTGRVGASPTAPAGRRPADRLPADAAETVPVKVAAATALTSATGALARDPDLA